MMRDYEMTNLQKINICNNIRFFLFFNYENLILWELKKNKNGQYEFH